MDGGGFLGAAIFRKEDGTARLQMEAGAGAFVALIAKVQISTDPAVPHAEELRFDRINLASAITSQAIPGFGLGGTLPRRQA